MSVKIILLALETLLLFLFLVPLPVICSGNLLGIIVSVMLMIITANWTKFCGIISKIWGHGAGKFGLIFVSTLILAGIIYVGILSILMYKAQENRPEKANVIVVLGCQVKGERPSRMLRRRLDAAITAMNDNPDTLCIVSGGKGDDEKISEALAMKNYLLEKGMDREGMLVEGFDRRSCFFTYYNYPYYIDHMAALGYVKDVDWIEELITVPEDEATIQRWEKISDFVLKRHRLHIHEARSRLSYLPLLKPFFELVNLAYAPLYGTVDLSDRQIKKYSAKFAPLINPNTTCFVMDENDRMVAFGVGAPSLASALQKHRGRLMPTGWIDVLKAFHRNDTVDLLLIAVHPDYQKKGVNAIILSKAMKGCHKLGIKQAETGPMLELNDKVQSQWKDFQTEQHKRRRCFIKQL